MNVDVGPNLASRPIRMGVWLELTAEGADEPAAAPNQQDHKILQDLNTPARTDEQLQSSRLPTDIPHTAGNNENDFAAAQDAAVAVDSDEPLLTGSILTDVNGERSLSDACKSTVHGEPLLAS